MIWCKDSNIPLHANGASLFFVCIYLHTRRNLYYGSYNFIHSSSNSVLNYRNSIYTVSGIISHRLRQSTQCWLMMRPSPAFLIRTKNHKFWIYLYIIIQYFRKVWKEIIAFLVFFICYLSICKFICPDNPGCTVFFWTLPVTKLSQWHLPHWIYTILQ